MQFNENHANLTAELLKVVLESIHKDVSLDETNSKENLQ